MATDGDPFVAAVMAVRQVAATCGVPVLLVGAYARDLLLQELGSGASLRRTRDVDFGVKVGSWEQFRILGDALVATGRFGKVEGAPHKVRYMQSLEVDLVPFGDVAGEDGRLACWPDDFGQEMNVLGYQEALRYARKCPIGSVPMVTLPAFVGLKILSWNDGPHRRMKDAMDLAFVLKNLSVMDEVLEAIHDWPDDDWDDIDRRCQRWLGAQMGTLFESRTRFALRDVLARESNAQGDWRLVRQMNTSYPKLEDSRLALQQLGMGLAMAD